MKELTPRQRATLKSLAHSLKPLLHVGKDGITDALARTIEEAFHTRELLKVRILEAAPAPARDIAAAIATRVEGVHVVQVIGRTAVLYRRDPEDPQITLTS